MERYIVFQTEYAKRSEMNVRQLAASAFFLSITILL